MSSERKDEQFIVRDDIYVRRGFSSVFAVTKWWKSDPQCAMQGYNGGVHAWSMVEVHSHLGFTSNQLSVCYSVEFKESHNNRIIALCPPILNI